MMKKDAKPAPRWQEGKMSDYVKRLRDARNWLNNGGQCCGQVDSVGTCAAPACIFGEALKEFYQAADRIAELEAALSSIARNTCCDKCQEAALVARAALARGKMSEIRPELALWVAYLEKKEKLEEAQDRIAELEAAIYQYVNHVVSYEGTSFIDEMNEPAWVKLINDTWIKQAALAGGEDE